MKRFLFLLFTATLQSALAEAPARIDACVLLQPEEIASVIGAAVNPGARRDNGIESNGAWSSSCLWTLSTAQGGRSFVILNVMQWPAGSGRAHEYLDSFRKAATSGVLSEAPRPRKFGDEALWWGDGLAVRTRDVSFGLSVRLPRSPATAAGKREERLAPLVLREIDRRDLVLTRNNQL